MDQTRLIEELQIAIERLADAVADRPPVAAALRRFAERLPETRPSRPPAPTPGDPAAIQPLLWSALADGLVDARRFDAAMLARARAARHLAERRAAYSPPAPVGSPSDSESSTGTDG